MNKNKALPKGLKISKHSTGLEAVLYQTRIVSVFGNSLILRSGGWLTPHTKKCINLILSQNETGMNVAQVKGKWIVSKRDGKTVPFEDGMVVSL